MSERIKRISTVTTPISIISEPYRTCPHCGFAVHPEASPRVDAMCCPHCWQVFTSSEENR